MSVLIKNPTTVVGKGAVIEQIDIESLNKIEPSRFIDKVYFNKGLDDERMMELLSQISYVDSGDGLFLNIVYCPLELGNQDKIIAIAKMQIEDFLLGHMIILLQDENLTPLWFSQQLYDFTHQEGVESDELDTPFGTVKVETAGWTNITDSILISAFCGINLEEIPIGADNELLKLVFSTTPFVYYKKELKGVFNGETLQANVGSEYFDGKIVDVEKMLDSQKLPLNIDVEYAKIKVDDTEVDLIGEYDGTTIEITQNGTFELEPLILENKLPLNVEVNVASGGGESDTVAIYRATRNPDWPYLPLPSEIAATSNKDTVYLLYDASGGFVCPTFTIEYNTQVFWSDITIEKYMNTTLVSSETIDGQNGVLVRMQYDYTDEDWDSYNYLLIKIEQQSYLHAYPYLDKLDLTTTPQYNGVDLNSYAGNRLLEVSGNANLCEVLFGGSSSIKNNMDLTYFSFNGIARTSLSYMFNECYSLITLPEIRFVVYSNYIYKYASTMFNNCYALQTVPLFDTSSVTNMSSMFNNCNSLQTVPLFDTSSVTNMSSMFNNCYALQTVSEFNTSSVTKMYRMFYYCYALQTVPLFDTSSVTDMREMFNSCFALQTVPLFDTSSVTSMSSIFAGCRSLQTVPLFDTSRATSMSQMFMNCASLQTVPLFDTSKVTSMSQMFGGCRSLKTVPLFDTSSVTSMSSMFETCNSLQTVPLFDTSRATSMRYMFQTCYALQTVPEFDTSKVTDISNTFNYCYSLVDINMYNMNISFSLSYTALLTREAIVKVLNNLATVTSSKTLTLGSTKLAKLTDEDKAIATNKGWTLA